MVRERKRAYNGTRLTTPQQAAQAFTELLGNPDREYFVAMMLDGKNRITTIHVVSEGSLNQSIVHPRETFKSAILANAAAVILAITTHQETPPQAGRTGKLPDGYERPGIFWGLKSWTM
jgi:DNA repair protein RadC